jgi:beta-mannosidase
MKTNIKLDGTDWQLIHLMPSEWVWRSVWKEDWDPYQAPAAGSWIPATVPGDVIADALDANLISNPYIDMNSRAAEWTSERDWLYRKSFDVTSEMLGKSLRLHFDGVDYTCHVYLNGELLGKHEGMFLPFEYDVTRLIRFDRANTLAVIVEHKPAIELVQGQIGWSSQARLWKSRFAYNWDWCTRLVPVGIWQSVHLIATDAIYLDDVWVQQNIAGTIAQVTVNVQTRHASTDATGLTTHAHCQIIGTDGSMIGQVHESPIEPNATTGTCTFTQDIRQPQLWFPNGMGAQPLYRVRVELVDANGGVTDSREITLGLRTIRAIPNDGAPADALPYTIEVNGRKMYVKGWNWAPIDNLYGRPQTQRYERLLNLAERAHCNLLRVWGGGLLERDTFYEQCDQLGILIWQEFHHSSSGVDNRPPEDDAYLAYIENQARQMVPLRRNHPSLAIWCGGNELMSDNGIPLTDAHPALAKLKAIAQELDPGRLWLPTSSSGPVEGADAKLAGTGKMHDVHGPWQYQGPVEQYHFFNSIDTLYHSEFGAEGAGNLYTIQRFISSCYQWPPDATNPAWVHHGSWWLHREKLEAMFGLIDNLETFIKASQFMQAEGLRYAIEANRRRKWRCSGTSPWQLNEAFPNTACTNAVDFLGLTKPAYWWIRRAYEPMHISAKYDRIAWEPGEEWSAEVWANNSMRAMPGCTWSASLLNLDGVILMTESGVVDLPDDASICVSQIKYTLPEASAVFVLVVMLKDASGSLLSRNEYVYATANPILQPLLAAPATELNVSYNEGVIHIQNTGTKIALFTQVTPDDGQWIALQDDYYLIEPGKERVILVTGDGSVHVHAWNSPSYAITIG